MKYSYTLLLGMCPRKTLPYVQGSDSKIFTAFLFLIHKILERPPPNTYSEEKQYNDTRKLKSSEIKRSAAKHNMKESKKQY